MVKRKVSYSIDSYFQLSLPYQTNTEVNENEYFLPVGRNWGRIVENEMFFYSQSIVNGSLRQHKICFGLPTQTGFLPNRFQCVMHQE